MWYLALAPEGVVPGEIPGREVGNSSSLVQRLGLFVFFFMKYLRGTFPMRA